MVVAKGKRIDKAYIMFETSQRLLIGLIIVGALMAFTACGFPNSPTEASEPVPSATSVSDTQESADETAPTAAPPEGPTQEATATMNESVEAVTPSPAQDDAYPAPEEQNAEGQENPSRAYPAPETNQATDGYPAPQQAVTEYKMGPDFNITAPIVEGATVVSGTGFAAVPIRLVDVSESGALLAETVVLDDGTFSFSLTTPLPAGHTIGLKIGDLAGTDFNEDDFRFSPNYYERPFVGTLLDLESTQPKE